MMSSPSSSLHNPQGLHRRQHSTPILAFEAMKMERPTTQRQNSQHRRGQSQDSRSPIRRQLHKRTGSAVSITNIGSTIQGQQILREAQQQRLARPGQQSHNELPVSPQCGIYQTLSDSISMSPYDNMSMNAVMQHPQAMTPHSQFVQQDFKMSMAAGLPMNFGLDENNHYFQNSHPVNQYMGGMPLQDRRLSHPELRIYTGMRPMTPTQQTQTGKLACSGPKALLTSIAHLPLTPATTPFRVQQAQYARSLQTSPIHQLQDENIQSPYPVSMQKSRSLQGIVEQDEGFFQQGGFEVADMPVPSSMVSKEPTKQSTAKSTRQNTEWEDAEEGGLPFFDENGGEQPQLDSKQVPVLASSDVADGSSSPKRPALSPRRMSISDLNLEPGVSASIEETNVSLDDIAQFIEGPDPKDNKWICRYEDCNKRFGRKENIKSHIQTHLGDRQFRCDHCKKCFVRGHDLKRHAKIHTGTKPYPCLCGNAFARHDALTRHRQRGMCIGAFEGIVKKAIKRGRPRKHRPEMDDRVNKASRTRHNQASSDYGQDQYSSSGSSCSMSSWGSPPTESLDRLSIRGQSPPYEDFNIFSMPQNGNQNISDSMAMPPDMFSFTPPASPGYSTGNKPSPSYRELTPTEIASISGDIPHSTVTTSGRTMALMADLSTIDPTSGSMLSANQMVMQYSQQSLPSLSHSSSSPTADVVAFDFGSDDPTVPSMQSMGMSMAFKNEDRNDFDSFLDYNSMEMGLDNNGQDFFTM